MDKINVIKDVLNYWYITEFLCQEEFPRWDEKDRKIAEKIKKQYAFGGEKVNSETDKKEEIITKVLPML